MAFFGADSETVLFQSLSVTVADLPFFPTTTSNGYGLPVAAT